jgi:catalase
MRPFAHMRLLFAGLFVLAAPLAAHAEEPTPEALVDALNAVFGKHAGKRAGHAKGICVKGSFTPSADASSYSKAPHFAAKAPIPVLGRFSLGGGNPHAADNGKEPPRGLALKFDLGDAGETDMVMISTPVFNARTPEQFLSLLQTVATKDRDKIAAFFKANPEAARQGAWLKARPVPASFASVTYYGVHTFTLTNGKGEKRIIKWEVVPVGGEVGLSDEAAKAKGPDFYKGELTERLGKGPAAFHITAVLGQPGDALDDPTAFWPKERDRVDLGTVSITAIEDDATCDAGIFDPTNVVDGIAGPANDTIFPMRSAAYAVSYGRRLH